MADFRERQQIQVEERLRQQVAVKEKKGKAWSSWVGSPVAWLALLVGGLNAYFASFRQYDDIRLYSDSTPEVDFRYKYQRIDIYGLHRLAFFNGGNRDALIHSVSFLMVLRVRLEIRDGRFCGASGRPWPRGSWRARHRFGGRSLAPGGAIVSSSRRCVRQPAGGGARQSRAAARNGG